MIKRGDTVMFNYQLGKQPVSARSKVRKVFRQRQTVLVQVWNGKGFPTPVKEQYEEREIPLADVFRTKRKPTDTGERKI